MERRTVLRKQSVIIERVGLLGCLPVLEIWKVTLSILEGSPQSVKAPPNQVEGPQSKLKATFDAGRPPSRRRHFRSLVSNIEGSRL